MSQIPQPTPGAWRALWWLGEHGWSTTAQLLDRCFPNSSVRTGYATLERMAEDDHLLQRERLVPSLDRRSQHVYGLDTPGLRLLGIDARKRQLVRGESLDLTLQLAEVRIVRGEQGWMWIPAHHLDVRWAAHYHAQQTAMKADPRLAAEVNRRGRDGAPKPVMTWLPPLPTLWHPHLKEARTVVVLTSRNARRLLPWDEAYKSALYWWRPVSFEVVTLPEFPGRERALERWLETFLGRLSRRRRVWTLHHAPDYRDRMSPRARAAEAG